MQKTIVIGHLGQDAILKDYNGKQFVQFSIADSSKSKKADGTVIERTQWFECTMNYTNVFSYLKKGQLVMVMGRATVSAYISKQDGSARASLNLQVSELNLLGGSNAQGQPQQQATTVQVQPQQEVRSFAQAPTTTEILMNDGDDDLPF